MAQLILVKHAPPYIDPGIPSPRWVLSDERRARCGWLAEQLRARGVGALYSSLEPKALETAALTGLQLGLEIRPRPDLHENDRSGLGFGPIDELKAKVRSFFEQPAELVMGEETAAIVLERFERAVRSLLKETPGQTVAVITHGTVLTLLTARYNPIAAFDFWDTLALPSMVTLDDATFALESLPLGYPSA